jgi:hypothetical protein
VSTTGNIWVFTRKRCERRRKDPLRDRSTEESDMHKSVAGEEVKPNKAAHPWPSGMSPEYLTQLGPAPALRRGRRVAPGAAPFNALATSP